MKNLYLLPNSFKKIGIILIIPFLTLCVFLLFGPGECDLISLPVCAIANSNLSHSTLFSLTKTDPINELAMIGLLVSIVFVALSKEKDEDEMTPILRQNAFIWSFWATIIIEAIGILFFYGIEFLQFSFTILYLYFMLYIIKFNITIYKLRREER